MAPKLYHIILAPVKGFGEKTTKNILLLCLAVYGILKAMEKIDILARLYTKADIIWRELGVHYPKLRAHRVPDVLLNSRLYRTAGRAWQEDQVIELGTKFLLHSPQYRARMYCEILPHELAHCADYLLFGESELACGHGTGWRHLMQKLGLEPKKYHDMLDLQR